MGKSESKPKKEVNKLSVGSKINQVFDCPYCNKKFAENMTYDQLNQHLKNCGLIKSTFEKLWSETNSIFSKY